MEKEIIEYLPNYLNYGVKINTIENELISIDVRNKRLETSFRGHLINVYEWDEIQPILYPMSYLTKEIEVSGKVFIPIVEIGKIDGGYEFYKEHGKSFYFRKDKNILLAHLPKNLNMWPLKLVKKLYEWHFAVGIPEHLFINKAAICKP